MKDKASEEDNDYILKYYIKDYTNSMAKSQDMLDGTIGILSSLFFIILSCGAIFLKSNSIFIYIALIGFPISLLLLLYSYYLSIEYTARNNRSCVQSILYKTDYYIECNGIVGWLNKIILAVFSLSIVSTLLFVLIKS